jgi:hypothetical protein
LSVDAYGQSADEARGRGWPVIEIHGVQHLAIATHPARVAAALLALSETTTA